MEKTIKIKGTEQEIIEILDKFTLTDIPFIEDKKECCNKQMIYLGDVNNIGLTQDEHLCWVCGVCGSIRQESTLGYDDEDLWNLLSNYQDEMGKTKVFKQLKNEGFD